MRIRYDPDADVLLLVFRDEPPVDAVEEPGGSSSAMEEDQGPVSVEFLNACARQLVLPGEVSVTLQTKSAE